MELQSKDGHTFEAYHSGSGAAPLALIVVQEIFGLNSHIRSVCDRFAAEGFEVLSPALFDRVERNVELGYGPEDLQRGIELSRATGYLDAPMREIEACVDVLQGKPIGVMGYCWGGTLAWVSAQRLAGKVKACVGYYGGMIPKILEPAPQVPLMLHFGEFDKHIPPHEVEAIRSAYPDMPVFTYPAGHGFNCEQRADYDPEAAALATRRSLEFLRTHLLPA
jgi:carboxymethylenebutenolidase